MDAAAPERQSPQLHGLVSTRRLVGALLVACVASSLLAGIAGGLFRLGLAVASPDAPWLGRAVRGAGHPGEG